MSAYDNWRLDNPMCYGPDCECEGECICEKEEYEREPEDLNDQVRGNYYEP